MTGERAAVLAVSVTEAGRRVAARLPFASTHGDLGATVRSRWHEVDGLVLCCATGIAVRVVAPLLADKTTDPAVVCVDEAGAFAVALCGGHAGGANQLARQVASLLGATPVVTTASDAAGVPSLDDLPGFVAGGDIAAVTRAWLDGSPPVIEHTLDWPLPFATDPTPAPGRDESGGRRRRRRTASGSPLVSADDVGEERPGSSPAVAGGHVEPRPGSATDVAGKATATGPLGGTRSLDITRVVVTDRAAVPEAGTVVLTPPSLVVGVGASTDAPADAAVVLLGDALVEAGLSADAVGAVATIDRRAGDPVVTSLRRPVRAFDAATLAAVEVPNPSPVVAAEVGTPSVAEAAALLAAGPDAELVVPKRAGATATVAVARRARPEGSLTVVGLGPGHPRHRTPAAAVAVRSADVVIGYDRYVDLAGDLLGPAQTVVRSPIGAEVERCADALARAATGARVALVCSGDPGVFAMATLVCELAPRYGSPSVEVVPGVTAGLAAAARLGAPLAHDHAVVSLSDLLTPWELIERRLRAVAEADMAIALYNPRSKRRRWQLDAARRILLERRPATTPVGVVSDATGPGERIVHTTLEDLDPADVGMLSLVIVGSSTTTVAAGRMHTPRGYAVAVDADVCAEVVAQQPETSTVLAGAGSEVRPGCCPPARPHLWTEVVAQQPVSFTLRERQARCPPAADPSAADTPHRRGGSEHSAVDTKDGDRASDEGPGLHPIEAESYRILGQRVDLSAWAPGEREVVARMIHATADVGFADSVRIGGDAVQAALAALDRGAPVIVDAAMVAAGVPGVATTCLLDQVPMAPPGSTRSAAAIALAAERHPEGALWVIGNAPTALRRLLDLHERGAVSPAAVIAVPVGFVGAAEAKAALWAGQLASRAITNVGERGGSPVAAAALNALHRLSGEPPQRLIDGRPAAGPVDCIRPDRESRHRGAPC